MRRFVYLLFILTATIGLNSCKTTQESTAETASGDTDGQVQEDSPPSVNEEPVRPSEPAAPAQTSGSNEQMVLGSELVSRITSKLNGALGLSAEQSAKTKDIMNTAFEGTGRQLSSSYPISQFKNITSEVMKAGQSSMLAILDSGQQERYMKFISR